MCQFYNDQFTKDNLILFLSNYLFVTIYESLYISAIIINQFIIEYL
jgi:hypothetical protein